MFAIFDAVRVSALESRSAQPTAPVQNGRRGSWSLRARLAVSGELHRLAAALSPASEPRLSGQR